MQGVISGARIFSALVVILSNSEVPLDVSVTFRLLVFIDCILYVPTPGSFAAVAIIKSTSDFPRPMKGMHPDPLFFESYAS